MLKTQNIEAPTTFQKSVKRIADSIREDAEGKICGNCKYYRGPYCGWLDIVIIRSDAVACKEWSK